MRPKRSMVFATAALTAASSRTSATSVRQRADLASGSDSSSAGVPIP